MTNSTTRATDQRERDTRDLAAVFRLLAVMLEGMGR